MCCSLKGGDLKDTHLSWLGVPYDEMGPGEVLELLRARDWMQRW